MAQQIRKRAEDVSELKEHIKAADTLGFTLESVEFMGTWETSDGHMVYIGRGGAREVEKVGRKYLHVPVDGEVTAVQPGSSRTRDDGTLVAHFVEVQD